MKSTTRFLSFLALAAGLVVSARAAVETYKIDPSHSSVGFGVRHFFTKVPGSFAKFAGMITVDRANLERSSVEASIEVASVNTHDERRDKHLLNQDFFLAEKFPAMTFKSRTWKKTGENTFDITGDLTIKDKTKEVVLKVTSLGFGPGMRGAQLSGWEAAARLDRRDFGLTYGQGVVGNDVDVVINIEAVLQK
jgi:polyisoprenoid-binding protein YceI